MAVKVAFTTFRKSFARRRYCPTSAVIRGTNGMSLHRNGAALITGASSGIGAAYAERLARRGHDLTLVARNRRPLDALAARISDETRRGGEGLQADLGNEEGPARL